MAPARLWAWSAAQAFTRRSRRGLQTSKVQPEPHILWTLLNKRGNSDTKERIALIQRFIAIFGKDRIVNVFADREFIGEQWFTWLIEQDINFCIRVKKTSLSPII